MEQLQGGSYEVPDPEPVKTTIPLTDNQACGEVNIQRMNISVQSHSCTHDCLDLSVDTISPQEMYKNVLGEIVYDMTGYACIVYQDSMYLVGLQIMKYIR